LYGGTERVVHYLTEELVRQGHEVTLFASGDSVTSANLVASCPVALRLNPDGVDELALHYLMIEKVFRSAASFDIIHFHLDYLHFPAHRRQSKLASITTLHGRLDTPILKRLYREYSEVPVVSISYAQRRPLPWINWQGTVHHGLPLELLPTGDGSGGYLAFLGRISPEKGVDSAIEIARRVGLPLKIAAKIDKADRRYFETQIRPLLDSPDVEFIGEIGESSKSEFLGRAVALLFPIDWPEPFGLVMIEAISCGTPVIAFPGGSVEEVVEDGITGFIVDDVEAAAQAIERISEIDRETCRSVFEGRFSARRMVADYLNIYTRVQGSPTLSEALEPVQK
jgi:glycosyltransferase involved in cell wall biosynthesis